MFSYTDPMEAIFDYSPWILKKGSEVKEVSVSEGKVNGKRLIARLKDVDTRNDAEALIGYEVYTVKEAMPELAKGEYYWHQLEGLLVKNVEGAVFGRIDHLLETGANDVMVVKATPDSVDDQDRLIPFVESKTVLDVNLSMGELVVDWQVDY